MSTTTQSRKQREIAQRHDLILDAARRLLLERGYLGLTMDRVAAATEYSKGTIYQHFKNKEELVVALTIQTAERRSAFFERAATFRGRSRERLGAVGLAAELFFLLSPDHFRTEHVIRIGSVQEKVDRRLREQLERCEAKTIEICTGIIRDALAAGDLELPAGVQPAELTFALWTMSVGTFSLHAAGVDFEALGLADTLRTLRENQHLLLDGYGWRPLSHEHDYEAVRERIKRELFPDECAELVSKGGW